MPDTHCAGREHQTCRGTTLLRYAAGKKAGCGRLQCQCSPSHLFPVYPGKGDDRTVCRNIKASSPQRTDRPCPFHHAMGNPSTDESAESGDKSAGDWDSVITAGETQLVTVGIAFGRADVVDVHKKRTVALEDVVVRQGGFQGCQC